MKTIEEKAKAYDEIIERAKTMLSAGEVMYGKENNASQLITDLIPELRESEDEKIRKGIIDGMKYLQKMWRTSFYGVPMNDVIAWLEKQKGNSLSLVDAWKEMRTEVFAQASGNKPKPESDEFTKLFSLNDIDFLISDLDSRGIKPKPDIEICPHSIKSKSYKENGYPIENCDYGLEIAYDILEKTFGEVRGYQTDDGIREHQTAIEAVRKAKEQNPAWSEEDKANLDNIIWLCENCEKGIENVWIPSQATQIKHLIKSLRPSWKPSEEQMRGLRYFLDFHRPQYMASTHGWSAYEGLKSLYVQLFKLK